MAHEEGARSYRGSGNAWPQRQYRYSCVWRGREWRGLPLCTINPAVHSHFVLNNMALHLSNNMSRLLCLCCASNIHVFSSRVMQTFLLHHLAALVSV
jgi:hypothetical protein